MRLISQVIITQYPEETILRLESLTTNKRVFKIVKDEKFLVEDVKLVIEKAYISSSVPTIIILSAKEFSAIIQNRLLKVIEEPPKGVEFILITRSKSTILPTIRSRIPIEVLKESVEKELCELDMKRLNLVIVYEFVKKHKRVSGRDAQILVERIHIEAIKSNSFNLDYNTLELFAKSFIRSVINTN
ncbi:MAG: DNA polymerase III subunit delta', partial [Sulfurovum sp.]|nr:DNA polymerase III subunit delta' [Sulfurovaceae bacterium]